MMLAKIGGPVPLTPEQAEDAAKANKLDNAMGALKWLAIGGGALFLYIAIQGRKSNVSSY